ncbi:MAG TPA: fasciclin domain-containing protein [Candidatus Acidoferrales bacterium]|nr:fasciclin domain-containing protein [Candidatus Acidoferrales bacterium]
MKFNIDIATLVAQIDELSMLVTAIEGSHLAKTLKGQSPLTVFAPDNDAFNKLPTGTADTLFKDKEKLTEVFTYHVINGKYLTADLRATKKVKTVQGGILQIHEQHWLQHGIKVNDAAIKEANLECANGVLHIIDSVLLPK